MVRHALHGLLNTVILLVLLLVGAAILVQTEPGKRFLATKLSSLLSTPDNGIDIQGLQGWIPIGMQIERLQLSDKDGIWLDASDIALEWSPSALFSGRIQIDTVRAKRLHLARLPATAEKVEQPSDEPFKLPPLPTSLPPVTVTELSVQTIDLDAPILGEAASFELDGSLTAADDGEHVDIGLDLQRIDQATAFLTLASTIGLNPATLALDLDAGETGNLLEQLTGRSDAGDLDLALTGKGPLDDWSGKLNAKSEGLGTADADISLALVEQPHLEIRTALRVGERALPADLSDLIGKGLDIDLAVTQTEAQAVDIERLGIGADRFELKGAGKVDFDRGDLVLNAALDAPDLQAFNGIVDAALTGAARITLNLEGTLNEPRGVLALRGQGLGADEIEVAELDTTVNVTTTAPLNTDLAGFQLRAEGSTEGLIVKDATLPDNDIAWTADILLPLEGAVTLQQMTVETAGAALQSQGTIDPKTLVSELDIQFDVATLRSLAAPYGQDLDGRASITAVLQATEKARTVGIDLKAAFSQLANLPEGANELIGEALDLEAGIDLADLHDLKVSNLLLTGANATIEGAAKLDLESRVLSGEIDAALPRLDVLASLIDRPIEGALDLNATIDGTLDSPEADLSLAGDKLKLDDEPIDALSLTLTGRDLVTSPEGELQFGFTAREMPLTLALGYRLDEAAVLALQDIDLDGPKTALDGDLTIDLDNMLIDGEVKGGIDDLANLGPLLEPPLEGAVNVDLSFASEQARQNADLAIDARNLAGDFGQIKEIDLTAAIQDLLGQGTISAKGVLKGFEQDAVSLSSLAIQAEGDLDGLALDLDLDGEAVEPLSLKAGGTLALRDMMTLGIDRLNGRFAGEDLSSNGSIHIEQSDQAFKLANLDLRLGSASLKGEVDIGATDVAGRLDIQSVPLAWLKRFDGPELDGSAHAELDLGGTVDRPRVNGLLNLSGIQASQVTATDLPPFDVSVRADLEEDRMTGSLEASGLTEEPLSMNIAHPLTLRLRPFTLQAPDDGELEGKLKAKASLARLSDILALDGQILKGTLLADLKLAGTIKAPLVDGPIEIEDGFFENIETGTVLSDVTMQANASSERIAVDKLAATVGQGGSLNAEGWIDLDPGARFPLSLALSVNQAELVSRDDIEGTITGDIAMNGNLSEALIDGKLFVNRAEISVPDGGGPNLPDIDVEEIGGNIVNAAKSDKAEKARPFDPKLDISIDLPNKVYVRGRGLESEWEGKLNIAGPSSAPRITGNLEVKKGYFDFVEKRFQIEKGLIDFNGTSPPNPTISVEAAATDSDFKAIVKVNGQAKDLTFRLESEPALPEDEVLSRLLFNRELSEIGAVEAGKLALALNQLRGGGGFDAFGKVRDVLNIDTLDIVSGEEDEGSRVKAGKYLNDDIYVEVEQGAEEDSSRARVEIELLPNLALEADTSDDAQGGVGVKWRFDY